MNSSFNPFSLNNQRILVTGASSGLGKEIALTCAKMGAEVICTGRDKYRLNETLDELQAISGHQHLAVLADLTLASGRDALISAIGASPLNGVVHSAGISRLSPIRMITEEHLKEVQDINLNAPMLLTQALLKKNLIAAEGSLVFIASIAAHIGVAGVAAYSGTKAALLAMVRCLSMEVVKRRIRVNCLSPALVETPLLQATTTMLGSMEQERAKYPLGFGKPEDVANSAVFLLSSASRWITGTTLILDGGKTVG